MGGGSWTHLGRLQGRDRWKHACWQPPEIAFRGSPVECGFHSELKPQPTLNLIIELQTLEGAWTADRARREEGGSTHRDPCKPISGFGPDLVELPFVRTRGVCAGHGWGRVTWGEGGLAPPGAALPCGTRQAVPPKGVPTLEQTPLEAQGPP